MARRETAEAVGFTPSLRMKMRRFEASARSSGVSDTSSSPTLSYDTNSQLYNAFLPDKLCVTPDDRM